VYEGLKGKLKQHPKARAKSARTATATAAVGRKATKGPARPKPKYKKITVICMENGQVAHDGRAYQPSLNK
jgi:hypothetical protein